MQSTKMASLYVRRGQIYICACHKTRAGFWIADSNVATVDAAHFDACQSLLAQALSNSRSDLADPLRDARHDLPLLTAAKASSWSAFARGTKLVQIVLDNGTLEITPCANLGSHKGFVPIQEKVARTSPTGDIISLIRAAIADAS